MVMFAKIFSQIFDSSIVEKPEVRFTFMDLLVLADWNGVVDMTHEAIARRTNRPISLIRKTIAELEGPDPRSRTPDAAGARIQRLDEHRDWGWMIINFNYFKGLMSDQQRKAQANDRVRRFREKEKQKERSTNKDIDIDAKALTKRYKALQSVTTTQPQLLTTEFFPSDNLPPPLNTPDMRDAWDNWQLHKKQKGETMTERAVTMALNKLKKMGPERAIAAIEHSMACNWSGIFEPPPEREETAAKPRKLSTFEIEKRIKAIMAERNRLFNEHKGTVMPPEVRERMDYLKARKEELEEQLTE